MNRKHQNTLEAIFATPVRANVQWKNVESLFLALGAEITDGSGSRVRGALNDVRAVFYRPHPRKEMSKGMTKSVCRFLKEGGVTP